MTIERLETIAAELYKDAEEATPIIGGADKKDWMARRLEDIVEQKEPALNDFLNCETTDQVIALLDIEYDDYKNGDEIDDEADLILAPDNTDDLILSDQYGAAPENRVVRPVEEILIPDETDEPAKAPKAEKETGIKDELSDSYVDDRAGQPEYIDNEPNYFGEPPMYEEEIIIITEVADEDPDSSANTENDDDVAGKC